MSSLLEVGEYKGAYSGITEALQGIAESDAEDDMGPDSSPHITAVDTIEMLLSQGVLSFVEDDAMLDVSLEDATELKLDPSSSSSSGSSSASNGTAGTSSSTTTLASNALNPRTKVIAPRQRAASLSSISSLSSTFSFAMPLPLDKTRRSRPSDLLPRNSPIKSRCSDLREEFEEKSFDFGSRGSFLAESTEFLTKARSGSSSSSSSLLSLDSTSASLLSLNTPTLASVRFSVPRPPPVMLDFPDDTVAEVAASIPRDRSSSVFSLASFRSRGKSFDWVHDTDLEASPPSPSIRTRPRGYSLEFSMLPTSMLELAQVNQRGGETNEDWDLLEEEELESITDAKPSVPEVVPTAPLSLSSSSSSSSDLPVLPVPTASAQASAAAAANNPKRITFRVPRHSGALAERETAIYKSRMSSAAFSRGKRPRSIPTMTQRVPPLYKAAPARATMPGRNKQMLVYLRVAQDAHPDDSESDSEIEATEFDFQPRASFSLINEKVKNKGVKADTTQAPKLAKGFEQSQGLASPLPLEREPSNKSSISVAAAAAPPPPPPQPQLNKNTIVDGHAPVQNGKLKMENASSMHPTQPSTASTLHTSSPSLATASMQSVPVASSMPKAPNMAPNLLNNGSSNSLPVAKPSGTNIQQAQMQHQPHQQIQQQQQAQQQLKASGSPMPPASVQARPVCPPPSFSLSARMANRNATIGTLTMEQRRRRIEKFLEKRKRRVWLKRVKYNCRKALADSRPRVKGRFVPRHVQNQVLADQGKPPSTPVPNNKPPGMAKPMSNPAMMHNKPGMQGIPMGSRPGMVGAPSKPSSSAPGVGMAPHQAHQNSQMHRPGAGVVHQQARTMSTQQQQQRVTGPAHMMARQQQHSQTSNTRVASPQPGYQKQHPSHQQQAAMKMNGSGQYVQQQVKSNTVHGQPQAQQQRVIQHSQVQQNRSPVATTPSVQRPSVVPQSQQQRPMTSSVQSSSTAAGVSAVSADNQHLSGVKPPAASVTAAGAPTLATATAATTTTAASASIPGGAARKSGNLQMAPTTSGKLNNGNIAPRPPVSSAAAPTNAVANNAYNGVPAPLSSSVASNNSSTANAPNGQPVYNNQSSATKIVKAGAANPQMVNPSGAPRVQNNTSTVNTATTTPNSSTSNNGTTVNPRTGKLNAPLRAATGIMSRTPQTRPQAPARPAGTPAATTVPATGGLAASPAAARVPGAAQSSSAPSPAANGRVGAPNRPGVPLKSGGIMNNNGARTFTSQAADGTRYITTVTPSGTRTTTMICPNGERRITTTASSGARTITSIDKHGNRKTVKMMPAPRVSKAGATPGSATKVTTARAAPSSGAGTSTPAGTPSKSSTAASGASSSSTAGFVTPVKSGDLRRVVASSAPRPNHAGLNNPVAPGSAPPRQRMNAPLSVARTVANGRPVSSQPRTNTAVNAGALHTTATAVTAKPVGATQSANASTVSPAAPSTPPTAAPSAAPQSAPQQLIQSKDTVVLSESAPTTSASAQNLPQKN
mmetsp:Transcript_17319/g.30247  ORF Transcript_17319/g.30247 Transcript_17319/m.30247 type:complete len:1500 (+) Transcript_17319:344-4843(+)|eukprot:CAMPEP_0171487358 /NCGR_PEP_ID=MMETSP0958-20121227/1603_1 /TAXON_ID=87120 /ORGANISM="Aurantiochytrium limacinum, Strain ATCCMYA-1381" /LENGTH=1499 /DNA_ID=CAMNT_0012020343 /DNA_START=2462 /DNA_END=6958 /DNA_ORIENTATION=-